MKRFPSADLVACASHHTPSWRQLSANSFLVGGYHSCCASDNFAQSQH
ncbi:MAG: hypothetical protein V7K46_02945 [Nostoc sp.]